MALKLNANYLCICNFFPGERIHHFHQIIKVICNPKEGLQEFRGIPVIHFISGLRVGEKIKKDINRKGQTVDLSPLFTFGK